MSTNLRSCLASFCALGVVGACSDNQTSQTDALVQTVEDLENRLARYESVEDIRKVQALYQHHMLRGDALAIVGLFADSPDVEIELSNKGVMVGTDAPRRYFLRSEGHEPLPTENPQRPAGSLILHTSVNPVIELNQDGTRAKALWLSPGITTFPRGGTPEAMWNYGKYEMEYIRQNEEWKILTFRWHQIFYSPADKGWVVENRAPGAPNPNPDRHSEPGFYNPYHPDRTNPFNPAPPTNY